MLKLSLSHDVVAGITALFIAFSRGFRCDLDLSFGSDVGALAVLR